VVSAIKKIASRQPSLLWVEDVHWLDPSSAELLIDVVRSLSQTACLVVLTKRSFPKGPVLPKADDVVYLEQLELQQCLELAKTVPGAQALSNEALLQAAEVAEGNPFFVEQLVVSLIDERSRAPRPGRHTRGLPLTLAEMMSERLDRLVGGRPVVQAAACIGRSFTPQFLDALLSEETNRVKPMLEALVNAEILRASPYDAEPRYEFRHALLQRMAHESMMQAERRGMHTRIVAVLKRQPLPTVPEVIAHHLTEAEQFHDAIDAWLTAGMNAARRSAHVEAIEHLRRGLGLLKRIPEPELRREMELKIQAALIGSLNTTQGATSDEFSTCCDRGLQLCNEGPPTPLVFPFLFGKFGIAISKGRIQEATVAAERFLAAADRNAFGTGQVIGRRLIGMVLLGQGELNKAREQLELSLQLYSPERDAGSALMVGNDAQVHSRSLLSLALFCLGRIDEALEIGVAALCAADALRHPNSTALALAYVGGWVFGLCGATEQLMREAQRLIAVSEENRLAPFHAFGRAFLGWALCQRGDLQHGTEAIQHAIESFGSINFRLSISGHLANLADAKRRVGELDEANALASRALELISESSQQWLEPEVRRILALIERDSGQNHFGQAEDMLRKAVLLAQRSGHPVFELRCLLSLRDLIGPTRQEVSIEARVQDLAYLRNLDRQVDKAVQKHGLALTG
jgi:tetratricopeptide (TPR) repeat protein